MRKLGIALTLTALTGCGTIAATNVVHGPRVYGGVSYDVAEVATEFPLGTLCALLDFPFSFLADTLMLPYTIYSAVADDPASSVLVVGFVIESGKPGAPAVEVALSDPLPAYLKPIAGAAVRVGSLSEKTGAAGRFTLLRDAAEVWETLRVEAPGFLPVEVPASELPHLQSRKYWRDHSLRIRLQRR